MKSLEDWRKNYFRGWDHQLFLWRYSLTVVLLKNIVKIILTTCNIILCTTLYVHKRKHQTLVASTSITSQMLSTSERERVREAYIGLFISFHPSSSHQLLVRLHTLCCNGNKLKLIPSYLPPTNLMHFWLPRISAIQLFIKRCKFLWWWQVGTPKTHRRFLARDKGTYGPMPRRTPKGLLGMPFNTTVSLTISYGGAISS